MSTLVARLAQYPTLKLILALWIVTALVDFATVTAVFVLIEQGILDENEFGGEFFESFSFLGFFLLAIVVAPILETWIFQLALLLLVKKLTEWIAKSNSWLPAFLITSLVFAAVHATNANDPWSIYGLINATARIPGGIALTLLAVVERARENGFPVLSVIFLHSLHNVIPTLFYALPA